MSKEIPKSEEIPRPPAGLARSGRQLWRAVLGDYTLSASERLTLSAACRQADTITGLEQAIDRDGLTVAGASGQPRVHPAVGEARQARLALAKLLESLRLPVDDVAPAATPTGRRAQKAAQARWSRVERRKNGGHGGDAATA